MAEPTHALRKRRMSSDAGSYSRPSIGMSESTPSTTTEKEAKPMTADPKEEEVVWGKTPGGDVFKVPTTHDVLSALFHPSHPKSHIDLVTLFLLGSQLVLFYLLPRATARVFFLCYFAFWRAAYDGGLGWVLTQQSKRRWIVREVQRRGWLDGNKRPKTRAWIRDQLAGKMGKDYSFDDLPLEYNTWLLFRQLVDIILLNDFVAYCMFAFTCFRIPTDLSMTLHVLRWLGGLALIGFNLWVKTEAHGVVKDYGWYWGDVFFQRGALVFDGVFELAPHPMYSVGYAGYYGLSLIVGSYPVLFVSLAAHAAQFAFLVFFENPHIERAYGQRKLLAQRTPLTTYTHSHPRGKTSGTTTPVTSSRSRTNSKNSLGSGTGNGTGTGSFDQLESLNSLGRLDDVDAFASLEGLAPSETEGETAIESDTLDNDTETETELELEVEVGSGVATTGTTGRIMEVPAVSTSSINAIIPPSTSGSTKHTHNSKRERTSRPSMSTSMSTPMLSQHDIMNYYFHKDTIALHNFDILRASDLKLLLLLIYAVAVAILPSTVTASAPSLFVHALAWTLFHIFGLGLLLKAQSERKFLVRHFLTHYHYPANDINIGAVREAFANWKGMYNLSMCMTYASAFGLAWKTYTLPDTWKTGTELLQHTFGVLLIGLHAWASTESYEVLGAFGWFFADFFLDVQSLPAAGRLDYTGIYRYLNDPESLGGAALFGLALITQNKLVFVLAVVKHVGHWWFLGYVEHPHMRKLYGDSLRKDAGFVKVMKKVASNNARMLESRAGRHAPAIKSVAREVKGTFDKVYEETAEAVEDFLSKSRPRISGVVQDTKFLLQQSRERLVITRVANNVGALETSKYKMTVVPTGQSKKSGLPLRFHLGEPIKVNWTAPTTHSRRDWIGLYRVGANGSRLVTKTSSFGMWVPVHDEEWDGDVPVQAERTVESTASSSKDTQAGQVVFKGDVLPWKVGTYEIRYHHDGKYNVMSLDGPIEIYVDQPANLDFPSVRSTLLHIVTLCLDSDPSLLPLSIRRERHAGGDEYGAEAGGDPKSHKNDNGSEHKYNGEQDHETEMEDENDRDRDPDDFRFWSERQAKRISDAIRQAFGVEYAPEVILADANVSALANRVLVSKEILSPSRRSG